MDAVNELSCDFAATILTRIKTNKQMTPQDAVNLIRTFYQVLSPLVEQNNRANMEKFFPDKTQPPIEKSAGGSH